MKWKQHVSKHRPKGNVEHSREGVCARNCPFSNAITIEECKHYNGSGPQAFGGAPEWPHLRIDISFREGEEAHRTEILNKIKALLDKHYQP